MTLRARWLTLLLPLFMLLCCAAQAEILALPPSVEEIEAEAFYGDLSLDEVVLPEGIKRIGALAFAESSLREINLPASLTSIAADALPDPSQVTVTAVEGTPAYDWAVTYHYIVPVDAVSLDQTSVPISIGGSCVLTATITPSDATNKTVTWSSSNTSVATVSSSGVVTAKAAGTADIAVTTEDGGHTAVCQVTVVRHYISPVKNVVALNAVKSITSTITPATLSDFTCNWTSSDPSVVEIDAATATTTIQKPVVKYTAKKAGVAVITGTTAVGGASCTYTVTVVSVALNKTSLSLVEGGNETLQATVSPAQTSDGTALTVNWTSSNNDVATVNASGQVVAVGPGTATITATSSAGGAKASCTVTVNVPVTGVSLNKSTTTIDKGKTETLTATVAPSDATNKAVTWTSSNTSVATVSSSGVVTAKAKGTATITVTTADGAKTASCTVTVNVPVTGVSLNKSTTTINKGKTETLTATVSPSDASNKSVTWTSSNTSIATVSSSGVVTAKAKGTATITVTTADGAKTASCTVTVNVPVTGVSLNKSTTTINKGKTETLTATVAPSDASNKSVTWTSSNTTVATVSSSGVVTAKAKGTATITVTTADGAKTASCTVTVNVPVTGVSLNKSTTTIDKGKTETLTATVSPSDASNKSVTWTSSNTSIATVSSSGVVTAKAKGTATITVTTADGAKTASCTVTVNVPVTGVSLNKSTTTINKGKTETLTATVTPSDASNKSVTWTSSNTSIATVSSSGVVTAKAYGTANITVTTADGGKTATCAVTVPVPVTGVTLNKTFVCLDVNKTETLTATVSPSNATNKTVSWTSSNTSVATVSSSGVVTAKAAGNSVITATTANGSKTAECTVAVGMKFTALYPFTLPAYDEDASYQVTFTGGTAPYRVIMRAYKEGVGGCIHEQIIESTTATSIRYSVFGDAKYKESGTYYAAVTVYDAKGTYIYQESRHTAGTAGMSITELVRAPRPAWSEDAWYNVTFSGGKAPYTVVMRAYQEGVGGCIHEQTFTNVTGTFVEYPVFGDAKFKTSGTYYAAVNVYDAEGRHVYKESAHEYVTVASGINGSVIAALDSQYRPGDGHRWTSDCYVYTNGTTIDLRGSECLGYARYVQYRLYGDFSFSGSSQFGVGSFIRVVGGENNALSYDASTLKNWIKNYAEVGAHIRTSNGGGNYNYHSLIITAITDSGFTIIDANSDGNNILREKTFTWQEFVNAYGARKMQYIEVFRSNASSYSGAKTTSAAGINYIKTREGSDHNEAYWDDLGGKWTIGYGHTDGVYQGQTITDAQAEQFLRDDLDSYEATVNSFCSSNKVSLNQSQFDALVSFTFNAGEKYLINSGYKMHDTLIQYKNGGAIPITKAFRMFGAIHHADGTCVEGLFYRRCDEGRMFFYGEYVAKYDWRTDYSWWGKSGCADLMPDDWYPYEFGY